MASAGRRSPRYTTWSFVPVTLFAAFLGAAWSSPGVVLALLLSIPWLAWRYDNDSGTFLVFAILFLLVLAIPAMLLVLIAVTH